MTNFKRRQIVRVMSCDRSNSERGQLIRKVKIEGKNGIQQGWWLVNFIDDNRPGTKHILTVHENSFVNI